MPELRGGRAAEARAKTDADHAVGNMVALRQETRAGPNSLHADRLMSEMGYLSAKLGNYASDPVRDVHVVHCNFPLESEAEGR